MRISGAVGALLVTLMVGACGGATHLVATKTATATVGAGADTATATTAQRPGSTFGKAFIPVAAVQLYQPLASYTLHTETLLTRVRAQIRDLRAAAAAGNLQQAQAAWLTAHMTWLQIGQDDNAYGAFGELGERIDGQAAGLPGATANRDFTGFHKVELDLWRRNDTQAAAVDTAVLASLTARLTPHIVERDLPLTAIGLDSWILRCHEILEDALRDSLTQNDDYGSNSDLASLAADVSATKEMLGLLAPLIEPRAPQLVPAANRELATLSEEITSAGGPVSGRSLLSLSQRTREGLNSATGALVETLAPVSDLMFITAPGA